MIILFVILLILVLYKIKFNIKGEFYLDYCEQSNILSWKGIFVLLIFMAHISEYKLTTYNTLDNLYFIIKQNMGQLIVVYFLFFSGYGIMYSIVNKGPRYVDSILKNRFIKSLLHFDLIILLYLIVQFFLGHRFKIEIILQSLIGWDSLGNSNWYIFAILFLYLATYISFKAIKGLKYEYGLLINTFLILIYIVTIRYFKPSWWYDSVISYMFGMYFFFYKEKIEKIINNKYILFIIVSILGFIFSRRIKTYMISFCLKEFFFIMFILLSSMKVRVKNKILDYLGKNVFGYYILQRLPMIIFSYLSLNQNSYYFFVIVCFVMTSLLVIIINYCQSKIDLLCFKN